MPAATTIDQCGAIGQSFKSCTAEDAAGFTGQWQKINQQLHAIEKRVQLFGTGEGPDTAQILATARPASNVITGGDQILGDGAAQRTQAHHPDLELPRRSLQRSLPMLFLLLHQHLTEATVIVNNRPAYVLGHALAVTGIDHPTHW